MTFDEWKAEVCKQFDAIGGEWKGYGQEMLAADADTAKEAWSEGITPDEIVEGEIHAND